MQKKIQPNELRKQIAFCLFIFSVGVWFLLQTDLDKHHTFFLPRNFDLRGDSGYSVSGPGCHIPELDIYDPSILEALAEVELPPSCDIHFTGVLVKSNSTHLYLDHQAIARLNLTADISCCYRPFWRVMTTSHKSDSNDDPKYKYLSECLPFRDEVFMEAVDSVRVECSLNGKPFYKDFYSFIPTAYRQRADDIIPEENVSVLILGIDGVSRLNFKRQMAFTHRFLTEDLKAIEFLGYHKIGDNTFPNLMAVLAGLTEKELTSTCWPDVKDNFDNCSFIWKNYKQAGFVTGFGEDASWMGLFQYGKYGFREQPTDVYLRTFNYVSEKEIGHDRRLNANICIGPKLNAEVLLDSVSKFTLRLDQKLSFGFFWENSLSHDYLNLPKFGDELHVAFLDKFLSEGIFDRSVVIVMSDHGIRWGKIRATYQGYIEERLPLLIVSCPTWFHRKFPLAMANFKKNSARLTTPFDLHETLKDFTHLSVLEDDEIRERSRHIVDSDGRMPRGISLFLPVPKERTCKNADIIDHWCTCHKDEDVDTNKTQVVQSAQLVIEHLNRLLMGYKQCSHLSIKSVLSARMKVLPRDPAELEKLTDTRRLMDFTIRIEADPGGGIFEATVQNEPSTGNYRLMGSVSRSNTYGNSSHCVSHYKLKLYCYCIT